MCQLHLSPAPKIFISYGSQVLDISSRQNYNCVSGVTGFWIRVSDDIYRLYTAYRLLRNVSEFISRVTLLYEYAMFV